MRSTREQPQLKLGLPPEQPSESTLRWCFNQLDTRMSFDDFMKTPAAIALKNWARAVERRRQPLKEKT